MRKVLLPAVLFFLLFAVAYRYPVAAQDAVDVAGKTCNVMCAEYFDESACGVGNIAFQPDGYCGCGYYCSRLCNKDADCPMGQQCNVVYSISPYEGYRGRCSGYTPGGSSSSSAPALKKQSPANETAVSYGTVTFSWTGGASGYYAYTVIQIFDALTNTPVKSLYVYNGSTSLTVSLPTISELQPGKTYMWNVSSSSSYDPFTTKPQYGDGGVQWKFSIIPATLLKCVTATQDTYVQENDPTKNFGGATQLRAGRIYPGSYFYFTYVKFDTKAFPASYDLAVFKVHQADSDGAAGGLPVHLHKVTSDWNEGTMTYTGRPSYDQTSWGARDIGGWDSNNVWYMWDVSTYLKQTTIPYGLVLRESNYSSGCDGSTSPTCRAGASRAGYLDSKESSANKPQICFYSIPAASDCNTILSGEQFSPQNHFKICNDYGYPGVCFDKYSKEYQGCIKVLPGVGCTTSNVNTPLNISCPSSPYTLCKRTNGDANCSGKVDTADYDIWKCEYLGSNTCAATGSVRSADFNDDKSVNLIDFEIWRNTYYNGN